MHALTHWFTSLLQPIATWWAMLDIRTFDDLTARNIRQLENELARYTEGSPDHARVTALIALNRLGVLTLDSQCAGIDDDGGHRREAVNMLVDDVYKDWLDNAIYNAHILVHFTVTEVHGPDSSEKYPKSRSVIARNKAAVTRGIDIQLTHETLRERFPVNEAVTAQLRRRWLVTITAKDWAAHEGIFEALAKSASYAYDAVPISNGSLG